MVNKYFYISFLNILYLKANADKYEKSWLQQPKKYGLTFRNYKRVSQGQEMSFEGEQQQQILKLEDINEFVDHITLKVSEIPADFEAQYESFLKANEISMTRFKFERYLIKVLKVFLVRFIKRVMHKPTFFSKLLNYN